MLFRTFGHRAPREPPLFLLWMILSLTSSTFGAIRTNEETGVHSKTRKSSHTKRDDPKILAGNVHMQQQQQQQHDFEFPYRYVFPANHPYSMYAHFLGRPPSANDIYSHPSPNHQNSYAIPSEYKYLIKHHQPQAIYQTNAAPPNPFVPGPLSTSLVAAAHAQPSPAPLILLVHAGPAGNGANGPFQTFVLIPADSSHQQQHQHVNNLAAVFANGGSPNVQLTQEPPSQPYGNVGLQPSPPNLMPITQTPPLMLFRPSHHSKITSNKNNNHLHGLLQRPISVYPMPGHKYYSHKKNSVESRMAEREASKKQTITSTEAASNYLTTRS